MAFVLRVAAGFARNSEPEESGSRTRRQRSRRRSANSGLPSRTCYASQPPAAPGLSSRRIGREHAGVSQGISCAADLREPVSGRLSMSCFPNLIDPDPEAFRLSRGSSIVSVAASTHIKSL